MSGDATAAFVEKFGADAAEAAWLAGVAIVERACAEAREGKWGRWRWNPDGEQRRFRRDVARGLMVMRFAASLQEDENALMRALEARVGEVAEQELRKRRQKASREAARVKHVRAQARREGRPPTNEELYPSLFPSDENGR